MFDTIFNEKNSWTVHYRKDGIRYAIVFPKKMKKTINCLPMSVVDENNIDVTSQVTLAMGINHDFHGIPTTPKLLGHKTLTLCFTKESVTFDTNDTINLTVIQTSSEEPKQD